jgi:beta-lactamase regulating signal transducer with metallopeptidase domain
MSDLVVRLGWSLVQVTVLALAAVLLYAVAARRGGRAAGPVTLAALLGSALLTLLAACPSSPWPAWTAPTEQPPAVAEQVERPATPPAEDTLPAGETAAGAGGLSFSPGGWLRRLRDATCFSYGAENAAGWPALAAVLVTGTLAVGLVRLLAGLSAVRGCLRRSRAVNDHDLQTRLDSLRIAAGFRGRVEVRETPELSTPAATGWLRSVILLPAGWRSWGDAEKDAALAHELAHLRRRDHVAGLLARLAVMPHGYHPVLRWLLGRFRLQQELAADALASRWVGGRRRYLEALARLALRAGGRPRAWPVEAMFSNPGTLMRRIVMLRANEPGRSPWARRFGGLGAAAVALCAVGLSALRGPAGPTPVPVPAAKAAPALEPFDLSYLEPGGMGVYAIRPAAIFGHPATGKEAAPVNRAVREFCTLVNRVLSECMRVDKGPGNVHLRVEEIEQMTGKAVIHTDPRLKENQTSLSFTLSVIRTVRPFDWKAQMRELLPESVEVRHAGGIYFKVDGGKSLLFRKLIAATGKPFSEFCWYIPDDRTIVFESEQHLSHLIEKGPGCGPAPVWAGSWKQVERGVLAVALDDTAGGWTRQLAARTRPDPDVKPFVDNASWMVLGIGEEGGCVLRAVTGCRSEPAGRAVTERIRRLLGECRAELARDKSKEEPLRSLVRLGTDLVNNATLKQEGRRVSLTCRSDSDLVHLVAIICMAEIAPDVGVRAVRESK